MATAKNAFLLVQEALPSAKKKRGQQRPLTYLRQVIALLLDPQLLASGGYGCYPPDLVAKAHRLLGVFPGSSIGSYTHTGGHLPIREACAQYLTRRDGVGLAASVEDVHVTSGSTEAIRLILECFGRRAPRAPAGVLVPAPGCVMYEAFARQFGVLPTRYRLGDVADGACWQLAEAELEAAYQSAIAHGSEPRILVLINPGSPTGHLLADASLRLAADFARRRGLFVVADEALQLAMHDADAGAGGGAFKPFRRVALETERDENAAPLEVASLVSLSRGVASGEAGLRIGFMELLNLHPVASATLVKVMSCTSCPPVLGQAALAAALTPPEPGEASHARYKEEISEAASGLRRRAALVSGFFAERPDFGQLPSAPVAGAFAYPRLRFPHRRPRRQQGDSQQPGVISIANELLPVDALFCEDLADRYGVAARPGSAFGQPVDHDGMWFHIRLSLDSPDEDLAADLSLIEKFHAEFVQRFAD